MATDAAVPDDAGPIHTWPPVIDGTVQLHPTPLSSGYELRARLTVQPPRSGSTDCAVELLFDAADRDTCYGLRLRELDGVRYCSLLRRRSGRVDTLVNAVFGFSFNAPLDVRVVVDGARIEAWVNGASLGRANDVHRIRHDAIGVAADRTAAEVEFLRVVRLHDDPLPTVVRAYDEPADLPLRHTPGPHIRNERYRIDFGTAHGHHGETVTAALSRTNAPRPPEELGDWLLLSGDYGDRADLHDTLNGHRLRFTRVDVVDVHTAVLHAEAPGYAAVSLTWSLRTATPRATVAFTPTTSGHHVVVWHGFAAQPLDVVSEVLCGPLQHARIVGGPESIGAFELTAPLCLAETGPDGTGSAWTRGLFIPADGLDFADEVNKDPDAQPYGMSLRDPAGAVRPTVVLPQYGRRAHLEAGQTARYSIGCYAGPVPLYQAYRELLRTEYDYRAYRSNVFGASLTDTVHNLIDLLASGSGTDDSVDYQASPSGWWSRGKGFIDIENDQAVRTTTTAVLLSAAYLTADMSLYDDRARPLIEYHLSRNGYGWTPKQGYDVYADTTRHQLCSTPFGITALGALHNMTRQQNPAIAVLAETDLGSGEDYWLRRAPMCVPLAAYRMTGDPEHLARARALADTYVAERVDRPATERVDAHDFAIYYCADWVGLLEMYEETRERRYLEAALTEARRFVTQVFVRPIHSGTVTVPDRPQFHDRQIELSRWWDPAALFDYPCPEIEPEPAQRWLLSITGLSFEALQTYRYSGPNLNPTWASQLLRLAYHGADDLLRDIAHNAAVGRFTNYPGYYFRQRTVHHMKPDFPFTGPFDNTTIYYHHAPAQLGMSIDYLLTEHETRSRGEIRFPGEFEENFVWFRFRTYGHRPGSFYGEHGVWLWMPRGVVSLDTAEVNWLTGIKDDRFYLSLTNSSARPVRVGIRFGHTLGIDEASSRTVTMIADGQPGEVPMSGDTLTVDVSGHGITALVVPGVRPPAVPMHHEPDPVDASDSYHFADDTPVGAVRGLLLRRPDRSGTDAYVQSRCAAPAVLHYSLDDGITWTDVTKPVHPAEWTVRLPGTVKSFRYRVRDADGTLTELAELRVPAC